MGTAGSNNAFRKAISLASSLQANIPIITCLEKRSIFSLFKPKTKNDEFEKERKEVEKQHIEMKTFAKEHRVTCNSKIVRGDLASSEILSFADQHDIDLIIMSKTKFSSRHEKIHHHSTLENVFRNTFCPVLILT